MDSEASEQMLILWKALFVLKGLLQREGVLAARSNLETP